MLSSLVDLPPEILRIIFMDVAYDMPTILLDVQYLPLKYPKWSPIMFKNLIRVSRISKKIYKLTFTLIYENISVNIQYPFLDCFGKVKTLDYSKPVIEIKNVQHLHMEQYYGTDFMNKFTAVSCSVPQAFQSLRTVSIKMLRADMDYFPFVLTSPNVEIDLTIADFKARKINYLKYFDNVTKITLTESSCDHDDFGFLKLFKNAKSIKISVLSAINSPGQDYIFDSSSQCFDNNSKFNVFKHLKKLKELQLCCYSNKYFDLWLPASLTKLVIPYSQLLKEILCEYSYGINIEYLTIFVDANAPKIDTTFINRPCIFTRLKEVKFLVNTSDTTLIRYMDSVLDWLLESNHGLMTIHADHLYLYAFNPSSLKRRITKVNFFAHFEPNGSSIQSIMNKIVSLFPNVIQVGFPFQDFSIRTLAFSMKHWPQSLKILIRTIPEIYGPKTRRYCSSCILFNVDSTTKLFINDSNPKDCLKFTLFKLDDENDSRALYFWLDLDKLRSMLNPFEISNNYSSNSTDTHII